MNFEKWFCENIDKHGFIGFSNEYFVAEETWDFQQNIIDDKTERLKNVRDNSANMIMFYVDKCIELSKENLKLRLELGKLQIENGDIE